MNHEIIYADHHRNGVGGAGFYVALVKTDGEQYLCIDFAGEPGEEDFDRSRFAVLKMDQLRAGNIAMHPVTDPDTGAIIEGTGNAAYRGADHWGDQLRAPIRDWVARSFDASMKLVKAEGRS